jgi:hypothetical protein
VISALVAIDEGENAGEKPSFRHLGSDEVQISADGEKPRTVVVRRSPMRVNEDKKRNGLTYSRLDGPCTVSEIHVYNVESRVIARFKNSCSREALPLWRPPVSH